MTDPSPSDLASLAPGARFCIRALAAGAPLERVADLLRGDLAAVRKHLRVAAGSTGLPAPPPDADEATVRSKLAPLLAPAAGAAARRLPSTRCPTDDVLAAMAACRLDGPLLLAELDHVADCPACLGAVLEAREAPEAPPPERAGCLGLLLIAAAGLATAAAL